MKIWKCERILKTTGEDKRRNQELNAMEIKQYGRKQISTDLSDNAVEELEPLVQKQIMG